MRKTRSVNPHAGPDELLKAFAKIGLRKVMVQNQQAKWRLEQAQRELAEKEAQALTVMQIVGDPLEEERQLWEEKQKHAQYMASQRAAAREQANGYAQVPWEPIAVESR